MFFYQNIDELQLSVGCLRRLVRVYGGIVRKYAKDRTGDTLVVSPIAIVVATDNAVDKF